MSYYCWKLGWYNFVMYFRYFLHKKTQSWHLENGNWFFMHRKWKLSIWTLFVIPICTIWSHLNKLFHDLGHDLAHLAWKPWNFIHDRSYLRKSFYNICNSPSLLFFLITRSHNMTQCEGFIFFWFFLICLAQFKMRSKQRA
jgi:hypothetical protein